MEYKGRLPGPTGECEMVTVRVTCRVVQPLELCK